MGLSNSLANALSGLTVSSRSAQLVSSNLANAMNENYARQEIEIFHANNGSALSSKAQRFVDNVLVSDRREAAGQLSSTTARLEAAQAFEQAYGTPDDSSSITAKLTSFDSALRFLESDPSSEVRISQSLSSANAFIDRLGQAEQRIQTHRMRVEQSILTETEALNRNLQKIVELNEKIVSSNINGRNPNALLDQRQTIVDQVGQLVPVRILEGANDSIALMSTSGMMLADTKAVSFDFTKANVIMPHMTVEGGNLSRISTGTTFFDMTSDSNPLAGGRLQSLFKVRDEDAVTAQKNIDELSFEIASRFQNISMITPPPATLPGLFTDNGTVIEENEMQGLAGRLSLNSIVDPEQGGESSRLRGGINTENQLSVGDSSLVTSMITALTFGANGQSSIIEQAASVASLVALNVSNLEQENTFANAQFDYLNQMHLSNGVDTDTELQKLLLIEKNYAANAKVLSTIDEMFDVIMRIN